MYDHLATYSVGLIALISLHHEPIRKQISELPEVTMEGTVRKNVSIPLEPFRPWLENLDKAANQEYLIRLTCWIAEKVLASSYEEIIKPLRDESSITEFFRHIRNGVSHGNTFRIEMSEKVKARDGIAEDTVLAMWRGKTISLALNGTKVIPTYLTPGDVFFLLWDMNEHLKARVRK